MSDQSPEIDWESLPSEEFANTLIAELEKKPAQLTWEGINEIDEWWRESMLARRLALALLCEPFTDMKEQVESDRKRAEAVADIYVYCGQLVNNVDLIRQRLEQCQAWTMAALACREDMQELVESAEARYSEAENVIE